MVPEGGWLIAGNERSIPTMIAEVFSDLNAEIAALGARRDNTRAFKQGLLQELLAEGGQLA